MKYLSICSGIEAASAAWHPLGWEAVGFSEIDPFPRAVLQHRFPGVPLHGDFTQLIDAPPPADVLIGGTPCQAFSVAGKRRSLDDARGNLSLAYIELANAIDDLRRDRGQAPCIVLWENVPGVLSVQDNAFGCFLAGLVGEDTALVPAGGKWTDAGLVVGPRRAAAWRTLDAQFFGLAQRRERVFVVASAREGFDPAAVLFEPEGLRRHSAPRREAGERPAGTLGGSSQSGGFRTTDLDNSGAFTPVPGQHDFVPDICSTLSESGGNARPGDNLQSVGTLLPVMSAFSGNNTSGEIQVSPALLAHDSPHGDFESEAFVVSAFKASHFTRGKDGAPSEVAPPLSADADRGDQDTLVAVPTFNNTGQGYWTESDVAAPIRDASAGGGGKESTVVAVPVNDIAGTLDTRNAARPSGMKNESDFIVAVPVHDPADPLTANSAKTYTHEGTGNFRLSNCVLQPVGFDTYNQSVTGDTAPTLCAGGDTPGGNGAVLVPVEPVAFDTYNQTVTGDLAQTLCSRGDTPGGNAHLVPAVAIPIAADASRANSEARTPSPDAEGRVRLRDPGLGVGEEGDPMFTLQATAPHAVAVQPVEPLPFDETQITHPANRSNPRPGDPSPPLARGARPPAIAFQTRGGDLTVGDISGTLGTNADRASGGAPMVTVPPIAFDWQAQHAPAIDSDLSGTLTKNQTKAIAFSAKDSGGDASDDISPTLRAMPHDGSHANGGGQVAAAFAQNTREEVRLQGGDGQLAGALNAEGGSHQQTFVAFAMRGREEGNVPEVHEDGSVVSGLRASSGGSTRDMIAGPTMQVRRLTPRECERLQGFPDDWTLIPWRNKPAEQCPDGPRYKALGNSFAVPVVRWIGARIQAEVDRASRDE